MKAMDRAVEALVVVEAVHLLAEAEERLAAGVEDLVVVAAVLQLAMAKITVEMRDLGRKAVSAVAEVVEQDLAAAPEELLEALHRPLLMVIMKRKVEMAHRLVVEARGRGSLHLTPAVVLVDLVVGEAGRLEQNGGGQENSSGGRSRGGGTSFGGRGSAGRSFGSFSADRGDGAGNRFGGDDRGPRRENNMDNRSRGQDFGSFGGSRFGGGDGDRATRFATEEERLREESYIPKTRSVDDIFGDDLRVKDKYLDIREEDEDLEISGTNSEGCQQILDNWKEAGFEELLLKNIERSGYTLPRKIQSRTIPLIMDGHDIKGHAETGSGKSAAFLLPLVNAIMVKKKNGEFSSKRICPYALIIEPTREMVIQLYEQALKLADGCDVSVARTYGKYKFRENLKDISTTGCDILIGTLGRFMHLLKEEYILLEHVKILVLDEADQLLEDESARDLRQIAKIDGWPKVEDRQTLLFSATFPIEVQKWADDWVKTTALFVSNKKPVSANMKVLQKFVRVNRSSKNHELLKLFEQERSELKAEKPDEPDPKIRPTMVFVKMKRTADVISTYLNLNKVPSTTINGDRPQKLRHAALDDFRAGRYQVVVTTDVCARGIDLKDLDHVINMDLPIDYTTYVHRIGRTGRIREGASTSFFDLSEDVELAKELVEGLQKGDQEVPDWLKIVADGKMPPDEAETASGANSVPLGMQAASGANSVPLGTENGEETNSVPLVTEAASGANSVPLAASGANSVPLAASGANSVPLAASGANSVPLGARAQDEETKNVANDETKENTAAPSAECGSAAANHRTPLPADAVNDAW
uniref:RNA helicase n=1 Tax=Globodera rostochiensis TaxID=31243 RepID=A0A914HYZ7_GLORO